jgi:glycyl-tRNA synthetase beta chain
VERISGAFDDWNGKARLGAIGANLAPRYAKADLASEMVGEFPELQGIMGAYYAENGKLPLSVAVAIRDHYRPQGPSDSVPSEPASIALALADKMDLLVGFFGVNERPTGSRDPYALRRAALGIVRIILENTIRAPLSEIIAANEQLYRNEGVNPVADTEESVLGFVIERLKVLLRDQGIKHDLVDAVFALGDDDLVRIVARVDALNAFLATDDGANLLAGYKRAANILRAEEKKGKEIPDGAAKIKGGEPSEEVGLFVALTKVDPAVTHRLQDEDFTGAMFELASLRAPVDAFFEKVLVNSEAPEERANRLKLLGQVKDLMGRVADFSQISG